MQQNRPMPGTATRTETVIAATPAHQDVRPQATWPRLALSSLGAFVLITVIVHLLRPDLDVVDDQMSLYLIGPWGHLLQTAYCVLSVGMLALVHGLQRDLAPMARSRACRGLFVTAAVALCITAFAWMDMPEATVTLQGDIHHIAATTAFLCATMGIIWQAHTFGRDARWRRHRRWALPWGVLCFASLWAMGACPDTLNGLGQKAVIVLMLGWLAAVSLVLLGHARRA